MKNTLNLITKLLLFITLSSAIFSKGFDLDIGATSPGLQVGAKYYIGKSFYVSMQSGFALISEYNTPRF